MIDMQMERHPNTAKIVPEGWNDLGRDGGPFHPFGTAWNARNDFFYVSEKYKKSLERQEERLGEAESRSVPPFLLGGCGGNAGLGAHP